MQKGFVPLVFVLIIGVLSIGIAGGSWYYKNYLHKKLVPVNSPNTSNPVVPSLANDMETKDWKSYNGDFFSFKYPQSWQLKDYGPPANYKEIYNPLSSVPDGFGEGVRYRESVNFRSYSSNNTVAQEVDEIQSRNRDGMSPGDKFIRKKFSASNLESEIYYEPFGEGSTGWYVVFSNDKNIIEFGPFEEEPINGDVEYNILSTLRFMTQEAETLKKTHKGQYAYFELPQSFEGSIAKGSLKDQLEVGNFKNKDDNMEVFYQVSNFGFSSNSDSSERQILVGNQPGLRRVIIAGVAGDIYQPQIEVNYKNKGYLIYIATPWNEVGNKKADMLLDRITETFKFLD